MLFLTVLEVITLRNKVQTCGICFEVFQIWPFVLYYDSFMFSLQNRLSYFSTKKKPNHGVSIVRARQGRSSGFRAA